MMYRVPTILFSVNGYEAVVDILTFLTLLAILFSLRAAPHLIVIPFLVINQRFGIFSDLFFIDFSINFYRWIWT